MSTTEHDIASFTNFALQKIEAGESDLSIDELFDQWRLENPSHELYAENVAAIQASIRDFKVSERGTLAGEHSAQLCAILAHLANELSCSRASEG